MSRNDKDNYDWLADFSSGGKDFYDLDHDGHIDAFEAGMMLSDIEEEEREFERGGGGGYAGCGCLGWYIILLAVFAFLGFLCSLFD